MTAQQLKTSILQLAIQGKLVPQNPADEPASTLLKRIKAEKDALVKAGKLKKDKHESIIFRDADGRYFEKKDGKTTDITDEIPFDIPESWEWARLKSFADSCLGKMLDAQKNKGSLMPYLRNVNVRWHSFDLSDLLQMRFEQDELERYEVIPGDLIVCEGGEPGRCAVWTEKMGKMRIQKALHRIRLFQGISSFYLAYVIQLYSNNKYLSGFFTGTTIKHLTGKALDSLLFPLPPLEEQARIVAKIEELLPHIEEYGKAETALSTLNAELPEQLKKSILQWAIQGCLVPQDPTDEPASELLKRIKAEKAVLIKSGKLKKEKPLPPISEDEIPFDIPESWEWCRIGDLFTAMSGLTYKKDNLTIQTDKMIRVLRGGNIGNEQYCFKPDDVFISSEFVNDGLLLKKNYMITPAVSSLEHIGKIALIEQDYSDVVVGGFVLVLQPLFENDIMSRYLLFAFSTKTHRDNCRSFTHKSGQAFYNLSRERLMSALFPLPPLAEQKRIVEKLKSVLSTLQSL